MHTTKGATQPREARASAIHPRTEAAWARAISAPRKPMPDDTDPDGFIRAHGPRALAALCGIEYPIPDFVGTLHDAWAARHPAEAAFRLAWPERCDAAALRPTSEEALRGLEAMDREGARKARAQHVEALRRLEAERARLLGEGRAEGDVTERARAYLAAFRDTGPGGAWLATLNVVRGFALGEAALPLLELEYLPRYHRKVLRVELVGMVRRALRQGRMEWGCKLMEARAR